MQKIRFTRRLSIRLSLIIAAVVLIGVCSVSGVFIFQDFQKTIRAEQVRLEDTSRAFAAASSAPFANKDLSELYRVLRGISEVENAQFISVHDLEGNTFAEIGANVQLAGRDGLATGKDIWSIINADSLTTISPIWANGERIGNLEIQSEIAWLRTEYRNTLVTLVLVALGFAALVASATNWVIKRALFPLTQMSQSLIAMNGTPDLSARFNIGTHDEIGVLSDAFNEAFDSIEERDRAIREHTDSLEETIALRTEELRITADKAERANSAKSDFLATMSHEIRTPMNGMLIMAELLSSSNLSARQHRFAEVISRSGISLLNLINDVLDMSKIEAGKLDLEELPFSFKTLIEDSISLYSEAAKEKDLRLAMIVSPRVRTEFLGDPTRLGQILSNLVGNALKFTSAGGITIRLDAQEPALDRQRLRLSVIDTGVGIAQEKLDSIFEAFSQADQSITRNYGGTGLGLTICRRLAEAMGGKISVASTEGKGAAFTVELELEVQDSLEFFEPPVRPYRVALLDDNEITHNATKEMLTARGLQVVAQRLADQDLDLILVDTETFGEWDTIPGDVPLIAVSRQEDESRADQLAGAHIEWAARFIAPMSPDHIEALISCLNAGDWSVLDQDTQIRRNALNEFGRFENISLLAVDDNAINREVLDEALSTLGVSATFATSGEQAVALAGNRVFDLILMDCSMPGMDGYEATSIIRQSELNAQSRIVALTAHVAGDVAMRWQQAGMDSYMAKPFTLAQLAQTLSSVETGIKLPADDKPIMEYPAERTSVVLLSQETLDMFEMVSAQTNSDMKTKVFGMFLEQVDAAYEAIETQSVDGANPKALKDVAHAMKSMCGSAGAEALRFACEKIETDASNGNIADVGTLQELKALVAKTQLAMAENLQDSSTVTAEKRLIS